jgi:hypothetical protein
MQANHVLRRMFREAVVAATVATFVLVTAIFVLVDFRALSDPPVFTIGGMDAAESRAIRIEVVCAAGWLVCTAFVFAALRCWRLLLKRHS